MIRIFFHALDQMFHSFLLAPMVVPLALLAAGLGAFWMRASPTNSTHRPELLQAVNVACERVPNSLPVPSVAEQPTLVLPFENDNGQLVTSSLRHTLTTQGHYVSVEPHFIDRWIDKTLHWLELRPRTVRDADTACRWARGAKANYVVLGKVHETRVPRPGLLSAAGYAKFEMTMYDASNGQLVSSETFDSGPAELDQLVAIEPLQPGVFQSGGYMLGVLIFSLLWPLALIPLIRRVLKMENNWLNAVLLLVIAGMPIALSFPWAFGLTASAWKIVAFVPCSLLAALWCLFVMSEVAKRTTY